MTILYEVSIKLDIEISERYLTWLKPHMQKMLTFPGFIDAQIYSDMDMGEPEYKNVVVFYRVENIQLLEQYLKTHAKEMRQEALDLFPNRFSAKRRILSSLLP